MQLKKQEARTIIRHNHMQIYVPKEERERHKAFFEIYEPYVYQGTLEENKSAAYKSKKLKLTCRFCKKKAPDTTFNQNTHLLSLLLGNKGYYSDDECDNCNALFGKFEGDLGKYLGLARTLDDITSKNKAPKFESGNAHIGVEKYNNGVVAIKKKNLSTEDFDFNKDTGAVNIKMETQAYTPANVYNAFLKMALSILPDIDVADYEAAYKYLLDENHYGDLNGPRFIKITESNILWKIPFAFIFQKKHIFSDNSSPRHVFCIYVRNYMFQIIFPMSRQDLKSNHEVISSLDAPYILLDGKELDDVIVGRYMDDLHSLEKYKRDTSIHMQLDQEALKNLVSYDPEKGFQKIKLI